MLLFQTLLEILKEQYNLSNFCFLTKEKRSFRMMVLVCYYQLQEEIRQQYQKKYQFQLLKDIISSVWLDRPKKLCAVLCPVISSKKLCAVLCPVISSKKLCAVLCPVISFM